MLFLLLQVWHLLRQYLRYFAGKGENAQIYKETLQMIYIRGMFEMNCLFLSGDFKFLKLAQKYSFHALEVLPMARNAKFQPMYPLLGGVTVR